jgi:hypothetical protein
MKIVVEPSDDVEVVKSISKVYKIPISIECIDNKQCPFCGAKVIEEEASFYVIHDDDCFLTINKTHRKIEYLNSYLKRWNIRR